MRRRYRVSLRGGVILSGMILLSNVPGWASPAFVSEESQIVTTRHQIRVGGRLLRYTARAGRLPILDNETGQVHAWIFFSDYTLDSPSTGYPRPLTFLWNGGPGASSSLVHLLGFGPRRLESDGTVVDNDATWLDVTDLVFVDPVGTGYSRPTRAEYGPEFYQTVGDAESIAEFIRVYRNRFRAWEAPIFLVGESYGVIRAAGVADVLQRKGITVSGIIFIGLTLPLGELSDELRLALMVPTYTAAAFVHKKLPPELRGDLPSVLAQAEAWARDVYARALARRESLSQAEREAVLSQLARFTGLDPRQINATTLSISMEQFSELLLADQNQVVGRYDTRLVGPRDSQQQPYDPTRDPSLRHIINDVGVVRYFRKELNYQSDLRYQGPFGGGYPPPTTPRGDWMSTRWKWDYPSAEKTPDASRQRSPLSMARAFAEESLRRALAANPRLRVFVTCGYYDLVCSYAANSYLASHAAGGLAERIIARSYGGGHAIYTDRTAAAELKRDVAMFIESAIPQPSPGRFGQKRGK
ncbi:MAG TPA: hypothetical protein VNM72_10415 [Blastocatellia bacterium]|nr:hypothetical protein [Blastocatellia bacterium]